MRRVFGLAAILVCFAASSAFAQSSPGFVTGQVPTAAQWNAAFASKQDYSGSIPTCIFSPCPGAAVTVFPNTVLSTDGSGNVSFGSTPKVPTPALSDNSTRIATTAYVQGQGYIIGGAGTIPGAWLATGAAALNLGYTPLNPGNNLSDVSSKPTALGILGGGTPTTVTSTGAVSVTSAQTYLVWNPGVPATATFTLPATPVAGETHTLFDQLTGSTAYAMTISANIGQTIDGEPYIVLANPGDSVTLKAVSTTLWLVAN